MAAVAERAGVATGTAYVHYASKDDLVMAAYKELKHDMGLAGSSVELAGGPAARFRLLWLAFYRHLASDPVRARFLAQVAASPLAAATHEVMDSKEATELVEVVGPDMLELFVDLPMSVVYDLSMGPIVRLVSSGESLAPAELDLLAAACWRAVTRVT
jgi:TetR/AcrR family transcriptional repressor of multidrug resistance operon